MDDKHRTILRKHRTALVDNLEPSKLLNSLDVLDDDDRDKLKSVQIRKEQAEELLDILSRRGPEAFQNFVAALYKSQEFLAKRLIQEQDSGIDVSTLVRDDIGMTSQHKQILRRSVQNLHHMDLHKMLPYLSGLLDELDKQSLLNTANPASQRVDMLLTEILPRKGPKALKVLCKH
ncbi:hypothetical protein OS493_026355 [Desmophyllum pertusum]|uniref:CARD domain-containing protein n=1 Tax=Desmophyllum pertusum TaxID=174260 RepID=A0A9X0CXA8_9CNID|nr:hypothetical protein OS493_026355 [Desmophyllum pertusum]